MAENPYGLQIAGPNDFAALLAFALPILQEDAAQPISLPKVEAIVQRCVTRDGAIAGVLKSGDGVIEASVGATIDRFDYTDEPHVMIRWLGVAPPFRRSDRAVQMVKYVQWLFETLGKFADKPMPVFAPTLTTTEHESKARLYQRKLPQVGAIYALGCLPDRTFVNFTPMMRARREVRAG